MEKGQPSPGDQGAATVVGAAAPWAPLVEEAARALAPEATALWDRALALIPADHPDRATVHARRARNAWALGQHATAIEHGRLAIAGTDRADIATHARATITLASLAQRSSVHVPDRAELAEILAEHAASATTRADDVALANALADQAITEAISGRIAEGARTATVALRLLGADPGATDRSTDATGDRAARSAIPARMALAVAALYDGRITDARTIADQFMTQVDDRPDTAWPVAYAPWAIDGLIWTAAGEHKRALRSLTTGRARAQTAQLPMVQTVLAPVEAITHLGAGNWDEAVGVADDHLDQTQPGEADQYRPWMMAVKALVAARRDDPATATALLDQVRHDVPSLHGGGHLVRWADATVARAEGRHDDAREILRALESDVTAGGSRVGWMPIALDVIHQEFEVGAAARARCRSLISRLAPGPNASTTVVSLWHGVHCLASGELGGLSDAANALTSPFPFESARFYMEGMVVAHWQGRTKSALHMAERAHKAFDQLGATVEQRRLAELLAERDLELPGAPRSPIGLEGLTEKETRIAALVCDGHSNAEVAAAVGIAIPKVEAMLHEIYAKAGVNDRLRLAALVAAHSPPWSRSRET